MYFIFLTPAQGNGYLILRQVEEWLDAIHIRAENHGGKLAAILTEAQHFLKQ